ncbi:unnamed protein product [Pseudo-nitzschia multistriata]|uniref:Uncharacterized protein n=1 Tax=Pseudo-nitzschia multistriata TaxID=183589 RepID=A0A448ZGT8_9STRA|nr:unnamed protein product [Pseudo-nitzschia multistriata]
MVVRMKSPTKSPSVSPAKSPRMLPTNSPTKSPTISPTKRHRGNRRYDPSFVFSAFLVLYGVVFIFSSLRIDLGQPQLEVDREKQQSRAPSQTDIHRNHALWKNGTASTRATTPPQETGIEKHQSGNGGPEENRVRDIIGKKDDAGNTGTKPFLTYRLELDKPYSVTYGPHTRCWIGVETNKWGRKPIHRTGLSKPLSDILNVTAYVKTNLRIISVGDSVGIQFHELLEEALEPPGVTANRTGVDPVLGGGYRTVYQNAWGDHESVSVSAPVHGGGALAAFRMTGLFLKEGEGGKPPNAGPNQTSAAGGWRREHLRQILDHNYTATAVGGSHRRGESTGGTTTQRTDSFDVMIYRIPHGWLPASSITRARLEASMRLARELLGVRTVVVPSLYLNNNVQTMEDLSTMRGTNQMIRELVEASWETSDLPDMLLMDFGAWVDQLTELNARLAGMDTQSNANYTLERLGCAKFSPSIALSCAEAVKPDSCKCTRNVVSRDGMHWCMETIGGRVTAGFACLIQCSLSIEGDKKSRFRSCQQSCNEQFMSLRKASSLLTNHSVSGGALG